MIEERGIKLDLTAEAEPDKSSDVFYNREMRVNRDISVSTLQVYTRPQFERKCTQEDYELKICDPLAASGVRGLRYGQVEAVGPVLINDSNQKAVDNMERNLELNKDVINPDKFEVRNEDANSLLSQERYFDMIDIDPFGSPVPFLDATARACHWDALAGFTATDLAPLYGSYPKTCQRRYASQPLKSPFAHEIGMRILLKKIFETFAARNLAFQPWISFYQRHYYRIMGRVRESKKQVNRLLPNIGWISYCRSCGHREMVQELSEISQECPNCSEQLEHAGPCWIGKLADSEVCDKIASGLESKGLTGAYNLTNMIKQEADIKTPFYDSHAMASKMNKSVSPLKEILGKLDEKGYRATPTHFSPQGFRTNASLSQIVQAL